MISRKDVGFYIDCLGNSKSIIDSNISKELIELLWELLALREERVKMKEVVTVFLEGLIDGQK